MAVVNRYDSKVGFHSPTLVEEICIGDVSSVNQMGKSHKRASRWFFGLLDKGIFIGG